MVDIITLDNTSHLQKPRCIMKYVLVYCSSGNLVIVVDEKELRITPGDVLTITSGQVHYVKEDHSARGFLLEFTMDFFCKDDRDIELIFHNGLFCHFAMNEVIAVNKTVVEEQLRLIHGELHDKPYQYLTSVHSRISLILVAVNRAKVERGDEIWKPEALFLKFLESVRANFKHNFPVSRFATILGTTELKLNEQAKVHAGKTAQHVIYGLIISEAKRLLTYKDLSVKEVAYELGFNDPFYFSNFFKRHAGTSPRAYQKDHRFK